MATSIRMILPPVADVKSTAGASKDAAEGDTGPGQSESAEADSSSALASQNITVTKTLEIKPATPRLPPVHGMHPTSALSYVQSPASSNEPRRMAPDMGHFQLPAIPNVSSIDLAESDFAIGCQPVARPRTAPGHSQVAHHFAAQPTLPPFMQSRRWARLCEAPRPKTSSHFRADSDEARPMTLREASFEQQRAAWKDLLPISNVDNVGEDASVVEAQGFCRTVSLPTWQLLRAARSIRGSSEPSNSLLRKLAPQRSGKYSRHSRKQSVDKAQPRYYRSSQIGRKRAISDLRKRASINHKRDTSSHVVNLDVISHGSVIGRLSSPVPSLHDPEKAKRFSEECEALLTNKDFEKDFLSSSARPSRPATSTSAQTKGPDSQPPCLEVSGLQLESSRHQASSNTSNGQDSMVTGPHPPARASSKGGARLATMVQMTKPTCIPILNGGKDGAAVAPDDGGKQAASQCLSPKPRLSRIPFRIASVASTASETEKTPRPAKSTDTLTLIEAQVRTTPQAGLPVRLKKRTGASAFPIKQLGPSGTPPERPLPELPAESGSSCSKTPPRSSEVLPSQQSHPVRVSPPPKSPSAVEATETTTREPKRCLADTITLQGLPAHSIEGTAVDEKVPGTPTSVHSQPSLLSDPSAKHKYARHDKSRFRADRMKQVKRRIKADLERQTRISEEREDNEREEPGATNLGSAKAPLVSEQDIMQQPSLDQLDQFPAVPASRPASRTSHHSGPSRRADSRTGGHVRQSSKASSRLSHRPVVPLSGNRQILGTSQIKVLVDTDPVTGHFRAGAMTPEQSSLHDGQSVEGSPRKNGPKAARTTLPHRIDENEQMNVGSPRAKTSIRSMRSHASAISARHSVAGSHSSKRRPCADTVYASLLDSSDEDHLLLTVSKNGKRKLRRRWNSNDIRTVQGLYVDLDQFQETLIRQERELQRQREEIQMMVRVLAPVSRANGLHMASFPAERQNFVEAGISVEDIRSMQAPSVASTTRATVRGNAPTVAGAVSPVRTTASSPKEKGISRSSSKAKFDAASAALDRVVKERPVSDLSTASGTTDGSRDSRSSKDHSAAEGSMTDPFEYDVGPAKAAAVATKGATHGLAIHGHTHSGTLAPDQSQSSRPKSRGIATAPSDKPRSNAPLHRPPPVDNVIPRGTLSEEEDDDRESVFLKTAVHKLGAEYEKAMPRSSSALSGQSRGSEHRLSVNHVFTRTEEMDRMLSVISALD